jgi:hypothetical protein
MQMLRSQVAVSWSGSPLSFFAIRGMDAWGRWNYLRGEKILSPEAGNCNSF